MEFTIIKKDGTLISLPEWQEQYGLTVDSDQLGKYFKIGEPGIKDGGAISELVIRVLDKYRDIKGVPVKINSLDRTQAHQDELTAQGYRTAATSPHVVKMAADIDTISRQDTLASASLLQRAASALGIKIRIGYKLYLADGSTFVHFDVCPEYYAAGKPFYQDTHPAVWEFQIEW